jgi:hypothetical protein
VRQFLARLLVAVVREENPIDAVRLQERGRRKVLREHHPPVVKEPRRRRPVAGRPPGIDQKRGQYHLSQMIAATIPETRRASISSPDMIA